jgi:hypothetical protein
VVGVPGAHPARSTVAAAAVLDIPFMFGPWLWRNRKVVVRQVGAQWAEPVGRLAASVAWSRFVRSNALRSHRWEHVSTGDQRGVGPARWVGMA